MNFTGPPADPPAGAPTTRSGSNNSPDTQLATFVPSFLVQSSQEPRNSMPHSRNVLSRSRVEDGSSPDPYPRHEFMDPDESFQIKKERSVDQFGLPRSVPVQRFASGASVSQGFNQHLYSGPGQYQASSRTPGSGAHAQVPSHTLNPLAAPHGPAHLYSESFLPPNHLEPHVQQASNATAYSYTNPPMYAFSGRLRDQGRMEGLVSSTTDYGVVGSANQRVENYPDMYSTPAHGSNPYLAAIGQPTPSVPNPSQPRREIRPHDRRFVVKNVPLETEALDLLEFFHNRQYTTVIGPNLLDVNSKGSWYVAFSDSRQAQECATNILNNHPSWIVEPVNENHFRHASRLSPCGLAMEDQVMVIVYSGPGTDVESPNIATAVKPVLELVGPVCTIRESADDSPKGESRFEMHELIVRYYDAQHAVNALKALNTIRTESFILEVLPYNRNPGGHRIRHWTSTQDVSRDRRSSHVDPYLSPEDRDRSPPTPERVSSNQAQTIDTIRICQGQDTRTTVMLKNVPNDMKWEHLKEILDQTSAGRYDFMYLRMDFEERQNVGYAFVNFVSPHDIVQVFSISPSLLSNLLNSSPVFRSASWTILAGLSCQSCKDCGNIICNFTR